MKKTVWVFVVAILSILPLIRDTRYVTGQKLLLDHSSIGDVLTIENLFDSPIQC